MGGGTSLPAVQDVQAEEVDNSSSSGLHIFELHVPSAGLSVVTVGGSFVLAAGAWVIWRRRRRQRHDRRHVGNADWRQNGQSLPRFSNANWRSTESGPRSPHWRQPPPSGYDWVNTGFGFLDSYQPPERRFEEVDPLYQAAPRPGSQLSPQLYHETRQHLLRQQLQGRHLAAVHAPTQYLDDIVIDMPRRQFDHNRAGRIDRIEQNRIANEIAPVAAPLVVPPVAAAGAIV